MHIDMNDTMICLRCRVGHLLAERKIHTAKVVAQAGMVAGACTLCVAVALVNTNVARDFWTSLFTPAAQQPDVETETVVGMLADIQNIWPLVMLFLIVDGLYALNGGLMRGLGLQGPFVHSRAVQIAEQYRFPLNSSAASFQHQMPEML